MRRRKGRSIHGLFLLDKPKGMSSNQALSRVKRLFQADKAGHTGSLDPLATGMLPICFGQATKYSQFLLDANKCYQVTGRLGIETETGDSEGRTIKQVDGFRVSQDELDEVLETFRGPISQVPPMYSALKKDGKPLYDYARRGIEIERTPRDVTIFSMERLGFDGIHFTLKVLCSKGTYIRSLVHDIGRMLNIGAHVTALHRHYSEPFESEAMMSLEALEAALDSGQASDDFLRPMDLALTPLPKLSLNLEAILRLQHGLPHQLQSEDAVSLPKEPEVLQIRIYGEEGIFFGVAEREGLQLKPFRMRPIHS